MQCYGGGFLKGWWAVPSTVITCQQQQQQQLQKNETKLQKHLHAHFDTQAMTNHKHKSTRPDFLVLISASYIKNITFP
jgi:hypothetical protein